MFCGVGLETPKISSIVLVLETFAPEKPVAEVNRLLAPAMLRFELLLPTIIELESVRASLSLVYKVSLPKSL